MDDLRTQKIIEETDCVQSVNFDPNDNEFFVGEVRYSELSYGDDYMLIPDNYDMEFFFIMRKTTTVDKVVLISPNYQQVVNCL